LSIFGHLSFSPASPPPSPTTWEPTDLSGHDPSNFPLVCLCPLLMHPTSPPHFQENHVIWVDLILIVPLGFHSNFPLSLLSFHNDGFCMFYIVHGLYILLYCLINTYCYCSNILLTVFLILVIYSRYFNPENIPLTIAS
jgi:hypothetical protein